MIAAETRTGTPPCSLLPRVLCTPCGLLFLTESACIGVHPSPLTRAPPSLTPAPLPSGEGWLEIPFPLGRRGRDEGWAANSCLGFIRVHLRFHFVFLGSLGGSIIVLLLSACLSVQLLFLFSFVSFASFMFEDFGSLGVLAVQLFFLIFRRSQR